MAQRGYFSHVDPGGVAPDTRILATGYQPRAMGENIAAGAATPLMVVNGWMESDGHCRNIMDATFMSSVLAISSMRQHSIGDTGLKRSVPVSEKVAPPF